MPDRCKVLSGGLEHIGRELAELVDLGDPLLPPANADVVDESQLRLALLKNLEISRSERNGTGGEIARVVAVLRTPCFVPHPYRLKTSARFVTGRSLRCARHDLSRAAKIVADL